MEEKSSDQVDDLAPLIDLVGFRLSTATVLFHAAVAERLGLSATDLKCWSIVQRDGPLAAGELAARVQLTTGAITGVLDRLERAGYVRRVADPTDRRRVVVEHVADPERDVIVRQVYGPMGQAIGKLVMSYSASEREVLRDFLESATTILEAETRRLRAGE